MAREQSATRWLSRYDTLLRKREEESRRERTIRTILDADAGSAVLPPSFDVALPEDLMGRRKRGVRAHFVPLFLPQGQRKAPELPPPPPAPEALQDPDEEPPSDPELAAAAEASWPKVHAAYVVDDQPTDPMALPPIFSMTPPLITIMYEPGDELVAVVDDVTEPMVPDFSPSPPAPSAKPPVRLRPIELTPPSMPIMPKALPALLEPPTPANQPVYLLAERNETATKEEVRALPVFELPNPWATEGEPESAPAPVNGIAASAEAKATGARPIVKSVLRAVGLGLVAAMTGMSVRAAVAHTRGMTAPAVVAPREVPTTAPSATAAPAAKAEGTLEITAPANAPVVVDGLERGKGPRVTVDLAPGYHMVRVGADRTQLVQVRVKTTASVDLSRTP